MNKSTTRKARIATLIAGSAVAAGLLLAPAAANASEMQSTTTNTTTVSAPAAPTSTPTEASSQTKAATTSAKSSNDVNWKDLDPIERDSSGTKVDFKNNTKRPIAITQDTGGGDADWTWIQPGQTVSLEGMDEFGTDIANGWIYFPSNGKTISFDANTPSIGWVNMDVNNEEYNLSVGETKSASAEGHEFSINRTDPTYRGEQLSDGTYLFRNHMVMSINS